MEEADGDAHNAQHESGQPSTSGLPFDTQDAASLDVGCSDFQLLKRVRKHQRVSSCPAAHMLWQLKPVLHLSARAVGFAQRAHGTRDFTEQRRTCRTHKIGSATAGAHCVAAGKAAGMQLMSHVATLMCPGNRPATFLRLQLSAAPRSLPQPTLCPQQRLTARSCPVHL